MGTILTDGKKTIEITMQEWDGGQWGLDWSADFFQTGLLPKVKNEDGETIAYSVSHLDYCVEEAMDWKNKTGDFVGDISEADPDDRSVTVRIL